MAITYKGIVRGNVVVLEDDTTLPEGTQVTVVPQLTERGPLRSLSEEELKRRKEVCERIEVLANRNFCCQAIKFNPTFFAKYSS